MIKCKMKLNKDSFEPLYYQLKNILKSYIVEGKYKAGESFPSEWQLAQECSISRMTARRALSELVREGLLVRKHGKGTFVTSTTKIKKITRSIGFGIFDFGYITQPVTSQLIAGIGYKIKKGNYIFQFAITDERLKNSGSYYKNMVDKKQLDGLILWDICIKNQEILRLKENKFPLVLIDRKISGIALDYVGPDNTQGIFMAMEHLIKIGHKRIGLCLGDIENYSDGEKLRGYQAALNKYGINYDERLVRARSGKNAYIVAEELLGLKNSPTAIVAHMDQDVLEIMQAIRNRGLTVPNDIAVVGFGGYLGYVFQEISLTSVKVPMNEIGTAAARRLIELIDKPDIRPREIVFKPELIIGASTVGDKKR